MKKDNNGNLLIVSLYADDLIFTGHSAQMFTQFKSSMKEYFDMSDLLKMNYFLEVEVKQNEGGISMSQSKYAAEILDRFGMSHYKPIMTPIVPGSKLCMEGNGERVDET